jgi:hypothetical protein
MSDGAPIIKRKKKSLRESTQLGDSADGFPDYFVPAYLILFDRKTKMYRAYHADMEDLVVMDDDPVNALESLIDIISMETDPNEDVKWN